MRLTKKRGVIALASVAVVAMAVAIPTVIAGQLAAGPGGLAPSASAPTPSTVWSNSGGSCLNNKMTYASNDATGYSTSSASFTTVPGMSLDFTTTGHCAEITYSAYVFAAAPTSLMMVHAVVDGYECYPGEVQFSGNDDENADGDWARSHSYTFVCSFGNGDHHHHNAYVQYRSYFGSGPIFTHRPTMVVRYG